jgi:FtsP/CotA-like multicopper oxidase with cupredoxin domain
MKRREFLKISTITSATIFLGCQANNLNTLNKEIIKGKALPIPALNRGVIKNGVRHYDLTIKSSYTTFFKDIQTKTYGINSNYLGETLLLRDGEDISINFTNKLNETTTMHGHGMHVPAKMDGGPHQKIAPNSTWSATYQVKQKACTNWYHPHLMGETARQVYMGLAGMIIVEDSISDSLDIPKRYGVDDIPLVLQDRFFDNSGEIDYSPSMREIMMGYKGDTYLTNGAVEPYFECEAKENRFRVLNGSNSSVYYLKLSDNRDFYVIATDNSFLEKKVTTNSIRLSPGERLEIVIDFSGDKGKEISIIDSLKNVKFLNIRVTKNASLVTNTPTTLTTLTKDDSTNVHNRSFVLNGQMGKLMINSKQMDINRIDKTIPLNQVEVWEIENSMMMEHNFHIHATHFYILERNGSATNVLDYEKGYKDTVYLSSGDRVKVLVKMTDYSDNNNPYMYHCHFLEHEDNGMMGQFVVS